MKELWKESRGAFAVMVILCVFLSACMIYMGMSSGQVSSADTEPFITDRVVEVRVVMSEEDWEKCKLEALREEYVQADFWFDGELIPDVAIRPKGNSSLNSVYRSGSIRLSFKVDFNFFNSARNFRGLKKLNFNNGFHDPTLIREHLSYEVFDLMGLPSPRTSFVDLWVNDTHMGLYTQVEQVDTDFLARHFSDTTGYLYKPEPPAGYLSWTAEDLDNQREKLGISEPDDTEIMQLINMGGANLMDIINAMEEEDEEQQFDVNIRANPSVREAQDYLDKMGLKTNEAFPDHSTLLNFLDILNNEPDETFADKIEEVLDVDMALRFIAVAGTIGYFDSYIGSGHNFYLYEVDGKFTIIPWDLNGSFGAFNRGLTRDGIVNLPIDEPTSNNISGYPLVGRLLSHEPYLERYHQYLNELTEDHFSVERMKIRINEAADLIRQYIYADNLKFYSNEEFETNLHRDIPRIEQAGMPADRSMSTQQAIPQPKLSQETLNCLRAKFSQSELDELKTRKPDSDELMILEECLDPVELRIFLGQGQPPKEEFQNPQREAMPTPFLSEDKLECIQSKFDNQTIEELKARRPNIEELDLLTTCLDQSEIRLFLKPVPDSGQAEPAGDTYIGLETFVIERTDSIKRQLTGE